MLIHMEYIHNDIPWTISTVIFHKKQMFLGKIRRDNGEANYSVEASISGIFERPAPRLSPAHPPQDQVGGPCR